MTASDASAAAPSTAAACGLALIGAAGALLMAVAHAGVDVPLLPTVGAGRAVPVAAALFGAGTAVFGLLAWALWRQRGWALPLGVVAGLVALSGAARPYRGVGRAIGIAISVLLLAALLAPSTRAALRRP